jgi:signal transduction histidine kinase
MFTDRQEAVEATAQRYRLLLYLASLLLLVALVRLGLRLRAGALALRRQAALEHVIAKNSTRLINCSPAEIEVRLRQALGELGKAIGAQRAYVALAENSTRVHAWAAEGATYPHGWPEQALQLSAQLSAAEPDIVSVPDVAALPPGEVKDALTAAGVRSWTCAPLIRPGRARGIIGFDAFHPTPDAFFAPPVARLAGDAVANAIERQFFEHERTRLTSRLERARRMQMIGTLAAGITHNFNNIFGAILGYAEMIEPQLAPGTKPIQHIDEIRRAAERARDLIDNILTFGRRRDASIGPVQVRALIDEAVSMLRASLRPGVELIVEDVPAEITILGDPVQLQQIILNLCANAAQAIQGNGAVRVTAAEEEVAGPMLLSHGELEPGSVRGRGSRFEAWLPALSVGGEATAGPRGPSLGHGETVLIVEGERECLLRHEEMLAALGYEPVGFERPASATDALRSEPDRFDAVLVTQAAAGSGSLNLARALHEIKPRQPVLFAATSASEVSADALAEAGIAEVLRQPLVGSEVAAALARFLRSPARYERNAIPRA